jgi:hypothetical protein
MIKKKHKSNEISNMNNDKCAYKCGLPIVMTVITVIGLISLYSPVQLAMSFIFAAFTLSEK